LRKDKVVAAALGIALALALGPGAGAAQTRHITVAGVAREYRVHLPAGSARPNALVLMLHGGGGNPAAIAAHTRFDRIADRAGFIVVYPAARNRRWLDGRPGNERSDDVAFLQKLADTVRAQHGIPAHRVFAAGISNGAMMSYRLACEAPGSVAAIGVVAGAVPVGLRAACGATSPVAVLALHGTEDRLIPFDGGGSLLSVPASVSLLGARAGCGTAGRPDTTDRVRDGTLVTRVAFTGCAVPVQLLTIRGGGHTWPGGPRVRARILGRTTREIDASEALWRFFDSASPAGRSAR
jgi:polyhydroxybutyrate depolymerase